MACAPSLSREGAKPVDNEAILVLAASDLQFAFTEIAVAYEQAGNQRPTMTFGSTGSFASQIENGAPADLFFAADQSFIEDLQGKGFILENTRRVYATGRIVVTRNAQVNADVASLEDLLKPEVRKIAIANPEHAPYGRAARAALQAKGLWDAVQPKLVLGENISQTFQFVQTGNADAGIVALSVALGVPGTPYTLVDAELHPSLVQEAAILKSSKQPALARAFLDYLESPSGRAVMKKYGFVRDEG
jgi:molybdate transport system substrate-binding protein